MKVLRGAWVSIKAVFHFIGRVVTVVLLTAVYLVLLLPFGFILWLLRMSPLHRGALKGSTWRERPQEDASLETAQRPY